MKQLLKPSILNILTGYCRRFQIGSLKLLKILWN